MNRYSRRKVSPTALLRPVAVPEALAVDQTRPVPVRALDLHLAENPDLIGAHVIATSPVGLVAAAAFAAP